MNKSQREVQRVDLVGLKEISQGVVKSLPERAIVLLKGNLGAGKTQFASFIVEECGYEFLGSPTFGFENVYDGGEVKIHHWDLYRIKNALDLESTGFWDQFSEKCALVLIEWPERLEGANLPSEWALTEIHLELTEEDHLRAVWYSCFDE
ncbi:MAG: tRNA (adenosine(37)-N6)-threonylcarbamoyltransferase complex ATPase subunit type 1 TsaE [Bdellovibrionales bacterium CG10_big_fil_rev_8_21_14_0_10_45_34]|nr:MAG: tRNA (adenosine(37)-N6)-threonylcarbamoyltransferase complex ATPase subunit type 1 TsaE [Bdellovibrionales bacterium CG10_big_fil_rev_8_21_14_0_10_45_34]